MIRSKLLFGWALVIALVAAYLYLSIVKPGVASSLGTGDQMVVATGVFCGLILWIWMLTDFFRRRHVRHRMLWGWILLLASLLAAAIYFVAVYFPQERGSTRAE
jgi:membrane protease YdiL (CAAX protease family)